MPTAARFLLLAALAFVPGCGCGRSAESTPTETIGPPLDSLPGGENSPQAGPSGDFPKKDKNSPRPPAGR